MLWRADGPSAAAFTIVPDTPCGLLPTLFIRELTTCIRTSFQAATSELITTDRLEEPTSIPRALLIRHSESSEMRPAISRNFGTRAWHPKTLASARLFDLRRSATS